MIKIKVGTFLWLVPMEMATGLFYAAVDKLNQTPDRHVVNWTDAEKAEFDRVGMAHDVWRNL